jgi:CelD/BcsL family acetyltransferase involved in cellulose biosynthesis
MYKRLRARPGPAAGTSGRGAGGRGATYAGPVSPALEAAGSERARSPTIELEPLGGLDAAREHWDGLAGRAEHVFATWEWHDAWWRHFGAGRPLLVTLCRDAEGRPFAILPLYLASRRPLRVLRFIGHGPSDQLGPVCSPADRALGARGLRVALDQLPVRWDVFLADQLPGSGWSTPLRGSVLTRDGSPVLPFHGRSWDEILAGSSRNFREQVRRRERKLAREHALGFRLVSEESELDDGVGTLFDLHAARWGGEGAEAFLGGGLRAFHRDFARVALRRRWLRLWIMDVDGRPAAAWYGFRFGGAESYYQAGRDPAWDRYSVGFVLLSHSIREAIASGAREYRFLRGAESYKGRFASEDQGLETVGVANGLPGRAALRAVRTALSLPPGVRRRMAELAG